MNYSPDQIILFSLGPLEINATLGYTWLVMAILIGLALMASRRLQTGPGKIPRWQIALEGCIQFVLDQIRHSETKEPERFLPLVTTLLIFIGLCNVLTVVPGFWAPTGSLSTTAGLAGIVFLAVPRYGIARLGLKAYLKNYARPNPIMLPFNILGEFSKTLALAVRLFGNIMSGQMIGLVLLLVVPLVIPVLMHLLGLLTGAIQAYIFAVLSIVYIASGMEAANGP